MMWSGWRPSSSERVFVLSALFAEAGQREPVEQLTRPGRLSWREVSRLARDYAVAPALVEALWARGMNHAVERDAWAGLDEQYRHNRVQNLALLCDLGEIARLLGAAGLDVLALKGSALLATVFAGTLVRHVSDIDLHLRQEDVARAAGVLRAEGGYEEAVGPAPGLDGRAHDNRARVRLGDHHPYVLVSRRGTVVELHQRQASPGRKARAALAFDAAWARSTTAETEFGRVPIPSPEDLLLQLCLHVLVHHRISRMGVRHLLDVRALRDSGSLDPGRLSRLRSAFPTVARSLDLLSALERAVDAGDRRGLHRLAGEIFIRRPLPVLGQLRRLPAAWSTFRTDPRAGLRVLFPARAFLAWKYRIPVSRAGALRYHLCRLCGITPRRGR